MAFFPSQNIIIFKKKKFVAISGNISIRFDMGSFVWMNLMCHVFSLNSKCLGLCGHLECSWHEKNLSDGEISTTRSFFLLFRNYILTKKMTRICNHVQINSQTTLEDKTKETERTSNT